MDGLQQAVGGVKQQREASKRGPLEGRGEAADSTERECAAS